MVTLHRKCHQHTCVAIKSTCLSPPWATAAAAAVGPGGDRLGWGHFKRQYKAPTDYTKTPKGLYNDMKH